jgi:hypothetical protein
MGKVPIAVVHYGKNDPETHRGGVEAFARNLGLVFEDVAFMHPGTLDVERVRAEGRMVVCDNQWVVDWPDDLPVVGFQHGVAAVKAKATGNRSDRKLAKDQARAAKRRNTIWVACAQWIAKTFGELHGNASHFVIHHQVDLDRFDGRRSDVDPRLLLHDARGKHKGEALVAQLAERFKGWKLEPLACAPTEVPDRMRRARAFVHLSRYEGNSIVCNEAMAMDLPLFATRVGLMQDDDRPQDVWLVDPERAFSDRRYLDAELAAFLQSLELETRRYHPRAWVFEHASLDVAREQWNQVRLTWEALRGG